MSLQKQNMLIIFNSSFLIKNNHLMVTDQGVCNLFAELNNKYKYKIKLFQFVEKLKNDSQIEGYKLSPDYEKILIPYFGGKKKLLSYIIAVFKLLLYLNKSEFTYIFYPGHVSVLIAIKCILFHQPYGLYVRGEYNKKFSYIIFRNAKFINTVGLSFKKEIEKINSNCQLIRPMVQYDFSIKQDLPKIMQKKEILFVGRIEKRKGVWEIIRAAEMLIAFLPEYTFRLIGTGADYLIFDKYIKDRNIKNVILNGPVLDPIELKRYYQSAKIFLFPSHDEGFPRVLYEAMYFGLPIITTFVGNIPTIMRNRVNCISIKKNSAENINEQIQYLLSNEALLNELIINGKRTINSIFTSSSISHAELIISQSKIFTNKSIEFII